MKPDNKEIRLMITGLKKLRRYNEQHGEAKGDGCPFAITEIYGCYPCRYLFPRIITGCPCDSLSKNYVVRKARRLVKENQNDFNNRV